MTHGRTGNGKRRSVGDDRRYTVRGIRRDPVDITKLSKALLGLVMAEAERQAQAEHTAKAGEHTAPETRSGDEPASRGTARD
jgi:hypothetical protein